MPISAVTAGNAVDPAWGNSVATAINAHEDAWTTWAPTWTNLTVGSGTVVAKYNLIGKTCCMYLSFVYGAGSAVGTSPQFTLPAATAQTIYSNTVTLGDPGAFSYLGLLFASASSSTAFLFPYDASSTYVRTGSITATTPFTWAAADSIHVTLTYETT